MKRSNYKISLLLGAITLYVFLGARAVIELAYRIGTPLAAHLVTSAACAAVGFLLFWLQDSVAKNPELANRLADEYWPLWQIRHSWQFLGVCWLAAGILLWLV